MKNLVRLLALAILMAGCAPGHNVPFAHPYSIAPG